VTRRHHTRVHNVIGPNWRAVPNLKGTVPRSMIADQKADEKKRWQSGRQRLRFGDSQTHPMEHCILFSQ
jgi:hypothetical protein